LEERRGKTLDHERTPFDKLRAGERVNAKAWRGNREKREE